LVAIHRARGVAAVTLKPVTIAVDETRRVSGLLQHPRGARACYVLAHGAGAGMTHPFMTAIADGLAERGVATLRELGVLSKFSVRQDESPFGGILAELRAEPYDLLVVGAGGAITRQAVREAGCSILVVPEGSW